jgi:hypothetical protein
MKWRIRLADFRAGEEGDQGVDNLLIIFSN